MKILSFFEKNHIKRLTGLIMCALMMFTSVSCGNTEDAEVEEADDGTIEIGFTFDSFIIERWERDRDVFVSRAHELGAEVNVQNANGDVDEQISQIEYFIDKKVNAIVIVAVDCTALSNVIAKAHRAGIKVISYDRMVSDANSDLYISFDNEKVGDLMAGAIISQIGKTGNILMINGPLTDNNVPAVIKGFKDRLTPGRTSIENVYYCNGWRPEYAFDYVNRYLAENPDTIPDAIMCGNDSIAGQTIKALAEHKLAGQVVVTGQDADLDACQRIVEGTQYMTVYKPVEKLAARAAELTVEMIQKGYIETEDKMNDGTYQVPYEKLEPIEVTAENMDEVIIGTFHQRNEVYLNVDH
ncbi:MAG: substrate-binding domain-containing protein [Lachnospiraceae bacterium]|nr:substrate-binding domain-containing protein [Lachnospiraceae bacterium]